MKQLLCLILCLLLLCGCQSHNDKDNTVAFYYCQANHTTILEESIVLPEYREISASPLDLRNVLSLYLIGPLDEDLVSPFRGMKLVSVTTQDSHLFLELSCNDRSLTDIGFSLACACLTMTCLELAEVSQVSITCGERTATMNGDNLFLMDNITQQTSPSEEIS